MLVHESSHQYFYVLQHFGSIADGSDTELYYSPVKRTGRPVTAILLAYHAFANVLLYYRECLERNLDDDGYCAKNEKQAVIELAQLECALQATPSLTPLGQALWEPLSQRINVL